ncbi:hypothetical protein Bca4012_037326 [Brassica carinata]
MEVDCCSSENKWREANLKSPGPFHVETRETTTWKRPKKEAAEKTEEHEAIAVAFNGDEEKTGNEMGSEKKTVEPAGSRLGIKEQQTNFVMGLSKLQRRSKMLRTLHRVMRRRCGSLLFHIVLTITRLSGKRTQ